MDSNAQSDSGKNSLEAVSRFEKWQQLQEYLSGIVGANLSFDPSGNYVAPPTRIHGTCSSMAKPLGIGQMEVEECIRKAFQFFISTGEEFYVCRHGLTFAGCRAVESEKVLGVLVVGPLLVGRREREEVYRNQCQVLGIDPEIFCDRVREIKVFSHHGIRMVMDFVTELMQCLHIYI